jgi:hypothetical protein
MGTRLLTTRLAGSSSPGVATTSTLDEHCKVENMVFASIGVPEMGDTTQTSRRGTSVSPDADDEFPAASAIARKP